MDAFLLSQPPHTTRKSRITASSLCVPLAQESDWLADSDALAENQPFPYFREGCGERWSIVEGRACARSFWVGERSKVRNFE
jgi:hypothetical protein